MRIEKDYERSADSFVGVLLSAAELIFFIIMAIVIFSTSLTKQA